MTDEIHHQLTFDGPVRHFDGDYHALSTMVHEGLYVTDSDSPRLTNVERRKIPRVQKVVQLGTADGEDSADFGQSQQKLLNGKIPLKDHVVPDD
jgi:hypothetical protein